VAIELDSGGLARKAGALGKKEEEKKKQTGGFLEGGAQGLVASLTDFLPLRW